MFIYWSSFYEFNGCYEYEYEWQTGAQSIVINKKCQIAKYIERQNWNKLVFTIVYWFGFLPCILRSTYFFHFGFVLLWPLIIKCKCVFHKDCSAVNIILMNYCISMSEKLRTSVRFKKTATQSWESRKEKRWFIIKVKLISFLIKFIKVYKGSDWIAKSFEKKTKNHLRGMMIETAGMLFVILLLPSILSDVCDPCISILREHSDQETKPYQFIYLFNAKWMRLFVFHSESFLSTDGLSDELTGEYRLVQGTCPGDLTGCPDFRSLKTIAVHPAAPTTRRRTRSWGVSGASQLAATTATARSVRTGQHPPPVLQPQSSLRNR